MRKVSKIHAMMHRYLEDLYTLTYQEDSIEQGEEDQHGVGGFGIGLASLQVLPFNDSNHDIHDRIVYI